MGEQRGRGGGGGEGGGGGFRCILCRRIRPGELVFQIEACGHAACIECARNHALASSNILSCWLQGCNAKLSDSDLKALDLLSPNDGSNKDKAIDLTEDEGDIRNEAKVQLDKAQILQLKAPVLNDNVEMRDSILNRNTSDLNDSDRVKISDLQAPDLSDHAELKELNQAKKEENDLILDNDGTVTKRGLDLFTCDLCQKDYPQEIELFINSNCLHTCCKICAARHIQSQLELKFPKVICWKKECGQDLPLEDCRLVVSEDLLEKFHVTSLNHWSGSSSEGSKIIYCPEAFCNWFFAFEKNDALPKWVTCQKCATVFCPVCRMDVHHEYSCSEILQFFNRRALEYCKLAEVVYENETKVGEFVGEYELKLFKEALSDPRIVIPTPQYALFENKEDQELVLSFRGTKTIFDAIVDFSFVQSVDNGGNIHFGIDYHLKLVRNELVDIFKKKLEHKLKLTIVGHSLGGGYALALMVYLLQDMELASGLDNLKVVTFGAPLIFSKDSLNEFFEKDRSHGNVKVEVWNFIHNDDIIPRMLGENLFGGDLLSWLKSFRILGKDQVENLGTLEKTFSTFKPVGNFVFLKRSGFYTTSYSVEIERGGPGAGIRRKDLWKISWPFSCVSDHKLKEYIQALDQLSR